MSEPRFTIIDHGQKNEPRERRKSRAAKGIVFCARCGRATTKLEAERRYSYRGYSACCNENLLAEAPLRPCAPATKEQADANERYKGKEGV